MADIETISDAERMELLDSATAYESGSKALRIIDQQAKRIAELVRDRQSDLNIAELMIGGQSERADKAEVELKLALEWKERVQAENVRLNIHCQELEQKLEAALRECQEWNDELDQRVEDGVRMGLAKASDPGD
jgi:hypothetical protein